MEKGYNYYRLADKHNHDEQIALNIFNKYGGERLLAQIKKNGVGDESLNLSERQMASTVIQWLGSNVGQSFLRELNKHLKFIQET